MTADVGVTRLAAPELLVVQVRPMRIDDDTGHELSGLRAVGAEEVSHHCLFLYTVDPKIELGKINSLV